MNQATRDIVQQRAGNRCEYCGLHQNDSPLARLHIEHILPKKHGGTDSLDNLALACIGCNLHKGSNVAGYDPETSELTELFHPRRELWNDHLAWDGAMIVGKSATGRTTIHVLQMNSEEQIQLRLVARS
ncbi:MAG: HNH endonuclease [Planctomycetaceae bacterium]|nr:MAG: HNH endonuclease [Planctomycetaceae bacterium]